MVEPTVKNKEKQTRWHGVQARRNEIEKPNVPL